MNLKQPGWPHDTNCTLSSLDTSTRRQRASWYLWIIMRKDAVQDAIKNEKALLFYRLTSGTEIWHCDADKWAFLDITSLRVTWNQVPHKAKPVSLRHYILYTLIHCVLPQLIFMCVQVCRIGNEFFSSILLILMSFKDKTFCNLQRFRRMYDHYVSLFGNPIIRPV